MENQFLLKLKDILEMVGIIVVIVGTVLDKIVRYYQTKNNKKEKIDITKDVYNNKKIHDILTKLRIDLDADIVYITQFHNGDHFISNSSILKQTVTHESHDETVKGVMDKMKSVLISKYSTYINDIVTIDMVRIPDVDEYSKCLSKTVFLLENEIKSQYAIKISNAGNQIIGYLSISFIEKYNRNIILSDVDKVANLLSYLLIK